MNYYTLTGNLAIAHTLMGGKMNGWRIVAIEPSKCPCADMENKVLYVPALPLYQSLFDVYTKDVIRGLTTHETGHALYSGKCGKWSPLMREIVNALEDLRIERILSAESVVCKHDLIACNNYFLSKFNGKASGDAIHKALTKLHLQYTLSTVKIEISLDTASQLKFDAGKAVFAKWQTAKNYTAIVKIAEKLMEIWHDEKGSDTTDSKDSDTASKDNDTTASKDSDTTASKDNDTDSKDSDSKDSDTTASKDRDTTDSKDSDTENVTFASFKEDESKALLHRADNGNTEERWIVRDDNTTIWEKPIGSEADYARARQEVNGKTAILAGFMAQCLKAVSRVRNIGGMDYGKLNPRSYVDLVARHATNVFMKRYNGISLDVAVSILVDQSGSMCGNRIRNARKACIAIAEALNSINVKFEILGHTTGDVIRMAKSEKYLPVRREYLKMNEFKSFDENYNAVKTRLAQIKAYCNNVDGEALELTAIRNANQRAKRHIVIVLSDGAPACATGCWNALENHLKEVVQEIRKTGMECYSIGIDTNAPEEFYGKEYSICIKNGEIDNAFCQALSNIIIKGKLR